MSTHLGEHFRKRRLEKGFSLTQVARMAGYTNIPKGIRRIETFEQSGYVYPDLVTKLATALDIDAATLQRLYYEDYRDWFAAMNKPVAPYDVAADALRRRHEADTQRTDDLRTSGKLRRRLRAGVQDGSVPDIEPSGSRSGSPKTAS